MVFDYASKLILRRSLHSRHAFGTHRTSRKLTVLSLLVQSSDVFASSILGTPYMDTWNRPLTLMLRPCLQDIVTTETPVLISDSDTANDGVEIEGVRCVIEKTRGSGTIRICSLGQQKKCAVFRLFPIDLHSHSALCVLAGSMMLHRIHVGKSHLLDS